MENEYLIECPICDILSIVRVPYEDEIPRHCPMCSADADAEPTYEEEWVNHHISKCMEWTFENTPFDPDESFLEDYQGFVYMVTELDTGKKYIGKKFFWKPKTLPVTKTRKRKVKTRVVSDWKKYFGSSEQVKSLVEEKGAESFKREILKLCRTKGECSYYEAKMQFQYDVLLRDDFYNAFIGCKIHAKHLPKD